MEHDVTRSNIGMPASARARLDAVMSVAISEPEASMITQFMWTTLLGKASNWTAASRELCKTDLRSRSSSDCRSKSRGFNAAEMSWWFSMEV